MKPPLGPLQAPKPKKEVKPPPPEPEADAPDAVPVVMRLADGRRINRRFRRTDTVEVRRRRLPPQPTPTPQPR